MADWKTRNEVPDSDEENEDVEVPLPDIGDNAKGRPFGIGKTVATNHPSRPNHDDSEDELALPGPTIRVAGTKSIKNSRHLHPDDDGGGKDELGHAPEGRSPTKPLEIPNKPSISTRLAERTNHPPSAITEPTNLQPSLPSSPLTALSSSPPESPSQLLATVTDRAAPTEDDHRRDFEASEVGGVLEWLEQDGTLSIEDVAALQRRSTRKRNAIQLNPYSVENQLYRQSIQRAGIAPVRIVENAGAHSDQSDDYEPDHGAEETQGQETQHQESSASGLFDIPLDNDEPPDLDTLLSLTTSKLSGDQYTVRDYSRKRKRATKHNEESSRLNSTPPSLYIATGPRVNAVDILSPPLSSQSPRERRKSPPVFRYPRGATPPQLQTPVISSEIRRRRGLILSDDSSDGVQPRADAGASRHARVINLSDSDESADRNNESEIKKVRRKIKGVLPASWLRIDQNKPAGATQRAVKRWEGDSPNRDVQRGVARPMARRRSSAMSPTTDFPTMILDDNDSSSEHGLDEGRQATSTIEPQSATVQIFKKTAVDVDSDSMEEDHIDQMLPPMPRQNSKPRKRNRRSYSTARNANSTSLPRQTRISDHLGAVERGYVQSKKRREDLDLSVVDVLDAPRSQMPDFLRIALRTTKRRRDRGRQSPRRKVIQLASARQPDEAQDTLSRWREQSLDWYQSTAFQERDKCNSRQPLQAIPGNVQGHASSTQLKRAIQYSARARRPAQGNSLQRQETLEQVLTRSARTSTSIRSTDARQPHRPQQAQRHNAISSHILYQDNVVPAQLEDAVVSIESPIPARRSHQLHRVRPRATELARGPILDRYFQIQKEESNVLEPDPQGRGDASSYGRDRPRLVRKRAPQHMVIEAPSIPILYASERQLTPDKMEYNNAAGSTTEQSQLTGLGSYGTSYTRDFDIEPLPMGSQVATGMLLGADYVQSFLCDRPPPDMMEMTAPIQIHAGLVQSHWGPWNEDVSSELGQVLCSIRDQFQPSESGHQSNQDIWCTLNSVNTYVADGLRFLDAIDRSTCLERFTSLLEELLKAMEAHQVARTAKQTPERSDDGQFVMSCTQTLLLSCQLAQIARDEYVNITLQTKSNGLRHRLFQLVVSTIFQDGISDLYQYQQALANCSGHWAIKRSKVKAEAFAVAIQLCRKTSTDIWKFIHATEPFTVKIGARDVGVLERKWFNLFVIMPFFSVGPCGAVDGFSRRDQTLDDWTLVLQLLDPVLQAYQKGQALETSMLNEYCRAVLGRCLTLISKWDWCNCELVLRALYDFFARNNLQNLPLEDAVGYPSFLADFHISALALNQSDKAFHIFLKIIGLGLYKMSRLYPEKKLRSIAFRLTPNHSRSLPKEHGVRQEDLDALRNHHNLLCVLYLVLPRACRPRLGLIRDLIRIEDSHRQACHISVRTWTDLMLFQLSTQEPLAALEPLASWYDDMLSQLLRQHALARSEVAAHKDILSAELQASMVASNQRQVEAVLRNAIHSLKCAINKAQNVEATSLLVTVTFDRVFCLFDAGVPRINAVIIDALEVVDGFLAHVATLTSTSESQDFGDWDVFEDYLPARQEISVDIPDGLFRSLHTLLSNCLGSNAAVDEPLVVSVISTWVSAAHSLVRSGSRWNDFIDVYGKESWFTLRHTGQTAKFTPLFFSLVIEKDHSAYEEHKLIVLKSWMASIVERESQLRYQARLTSAIFNYDPGNPLLENLPFSRDRAGDSFNVTVSELCTRRLSLISCVLSNMAESLLFSTYHELTDGPARRHEYAELLKTLMKAMKANYTMLGTGVEMRGAYVDFVQAVVGFLQQHTNHIQPIDRFFTDAKNFPLPIHDPGYVISRLKSYQIKLTESHGPKQLVAFIQSIVERAVIDGHQEYLIGQLQTALQGAFESGDASRLTLRAFVLESIVPAYVDAAFDTECGWLLAVPLLQSLPEVIHTILLDMDATNPGSVAAVLHTLEGLLHGLQSATSKTADHQARPEHIKATTTTHMLILVYNVLTAALRPLDYCMRLQPTSYASITSHIAFFRSFGAYAFARTTKRPVPPLLFDISTTPSSSPDPTRAYAVTNLRAALAKWHIRVTSGGSEYEVRGAGGTRVVRAGLGEADQGFSGLREALVRFEFTAGRLASFRLEE